MFTTAIVLKNTYLIVPIVKSFPQTPTGDGGGERVHMTALVEICKVLERQEY